jgi:hypothetical protein
MSVRTNRDSEGYGPTVSFGETAQVAVPLVAPVVVVVVVVVLVDVGLVGVSPQAPVSAAPAAPSSPSARRRLTMVRGFITFDISFLSGGQRRLAKWHRLSSIGNASRPTSAAAC